MTKDEQHKHIMQYIATMQQKAVDLHAQDAPRDVYATIIKGCANVIIAFADAEIAINEDSKIGF